MSADRVVLIGAGLIGLAFLLPSAPGGGGNAPHSSEEARSGPAKRLPSPASTDAPASGAARDLVRAEDGHFYAEGRINGARIRFLVDTGASMVALTPADAQRAGIQLPSERVSAQSAGGTLEITPITIDRLAVGTLEARDVAGAVAPDLPVSLLGQTFLGKVGSVRISGDRMTLQ